MTLLEMAQGLAKNVGLEVPSVVLASPDREWVEFAHLSAQEGTELSRRVDWGQQQKTVTITGTGAATTFDLPDDFSRITKGAIAQPPMRPLSLAEFQTIPMQEGTPRYYFLQYKKIQFYPYLAAGATVTVPYQSRNFIDGGSDVWTVDTEEPALDADLMLRGVIVRWRRQKGMDYADYEAEYEANIRDLAEFNQDSRIL